MTRTARTVRHSLDDTADILHVLIGYLEGHHYGDVKTLRSITVGEPPVSNRSTIKSQCCAPPGFPAPADRGESFAYRILSIDVHDDHAVAMVRDASLGTSGMPVQLLRADGAWYVDVGWVSPVGWQP
jgi:hypothetical protein